jgi:hypothetical protein
MIMHGCSTCVIFSCEIFLWEIIQCSACIHSSKFVSLFIARTYPDNGWRMAELQMFAVAGDKYLVFDGKILHKQAFSNKVKQNHAGAALVAGVIGDKLPPGDSAYIIQRMEKVKKAFQGRISHIIKTSCLENAKKMGIKIGSNSTLLQTWDELLQELESNSKVESFVNWYNICYKENDTCGTSKKREGEACMMRDLKIKYQDNTNTGGCLGELFLAECSNLIETIVSRSRTKQNLHIVKSRPIKGEEEYVFGQSHQKGKRAVGDFYVVRSNPRDGKAVTYRKFNVSAVV